jgi:hypothetical protein
MALPFANRTAPADQLTLAPGTQLSVFKLSVPPFMLMVAPVRRFVVPLRATSAPVERFMVAEAAG